jgi:hypothetical protein
MRVSRVWIEVQDFLGFDQFNGYLGEDDDSGRRRHRLSKRREVAVSQRIATTPVLRRPKPGSPFLFRPLALLGAMSSFLGFVPAGRPSPSEVVLRTERHMPDPQVAVPMGEWHLAELVDDSLRVWRADTKASLVMLQISALDRIEFEGVLVLGLRVGVGFRL